MALFSIVYSNTVLPQTIQPESIIYISPKPGSGLVSPFTNIILRLPEGKDISGISNQNLITVRGGFSGIHSGRLQIVDNNRTIIFKPFQKFTEGEKVYVKILLSALNSGSNADGDTLNYTFTISKSWKLSKIKHNDLEEEFENPVLEFQDQEQAYPKNSIDEANADSLPDDLPNVYVTLSNNPDDGSIFIAPWYYQGSFFDPNYLMIIDNYGVPIYYKRNDILALDFKVQPNGMITYHDRNLFAVIEMDSAYNPIDTFRCGNGYRMDFHDIQLLNNGHYLVLAQDYETIRMDTVVTGGDTAATVIGCIVQELDENDNVVFQWRSWDHFKITDASYAVNLTAHSIDYVHANSIELDNDGNLLLSCRHMNEITKINRLTGDIMWRLGGKNNQFQFLNDPRGFTYQHDVRRIGNRDITIFDNGDLSVPRYSSSLEYSINEIDKTLSLVWSYSDGDHYSGSMGNTQRLNNGETFIGWGSSDNPAATEVDNNGVKRFEIKFDPLYFNYRTFRFNWRTNLLIANNYEINFEDLAVNSSSIKKFIVTNNSDDTLMIKKYYTRTSEFSLTDEFPIVLEPHGIRIIHVKFSPDRSGTLSDNIYLMVYRENEMIAQSIKVNGTVFSQAANVIRDNQPLTFGLQQNYPNPFNPATKIEYQIPEGSFVTIKLYDVLGNEITSLVNEEKQAGSYEVEFDASNLPSGIYVYQLKADKFVETKKMVLLK